MSMIASFVDGFSCDGLDSKLVEGEEGSVLGDSDSSLQDFDRSLGSKRKNKKICFSNHEEFILLLRKISGVEDCESSGKNESRESSDEEMLPPSPFMYRRHIPRIVVWKSPCDDRNEKDVETGVPGRGNHSDPDLDFYERSSSPKSSEGNPHNVCEVEASKRGNKEEEEDTHPTLKTITEAKTNFGEEEKETLVSATTVSMQDNIGPILLNRSKAPARPLSPTCSSGGMEPQSGTSSNTEKNVFSPLGDRLTSLRQELVSCCVQQNVVEPDDAHCTNEDIAECCQDDAESDSDVPSVIECQPARDGSLEGLVIDMDCSVEKEKDAKPREESQVLKRVLPSTKLIGNPVGSARITGNGKPAIPPLREPNEVRVLSQPSDEITTKANSLTLQGTSVPVMQVKQASPDAKQGNADVKKSDSRTGLGKVKPESLQNSSQAKVPNPQVEYTNLPAISPLEETSSKDLPFSLSNKRPSPQTLPPANRLAIEVSLEAMKPGLQALKPCRKDTTFAKDLSPQSPKRSPLSPERNHQVKSASPEIKIFSPEDQTVSMALTQQCGHEESKPIPHIQESNPSDLQSKSQMKKKSPSSPQSKLTSPETRAVSFSDVAVEDGNPDARSVPSSTSGFDDLEQEGQASNPQGLPVGCFMPLHDQIIDKVSHVVVMEGGSTTLLSDSGKFEGQQGVHGQQEAEENLDQAASFKRETELPSEIGKGASPQPESSNTSIIMDSSSFIDSFAAEVRSIFSDKPEHRHPGDGDDDRAKSISCSFSDMESSRQDARFVDEDGRSVSASEMEPAVLMLNDSQSGTKQWAEEDKKTFPEASSTLAEGGEGRGKDQQVVRDSSSEEGVDPLESVSTTTQTEPNGVRLRRSGMGPHSTFLSNIHVGFPSLNYEVDIAVQRTSLTPDPLEEQKPSELGTTSETKEVSVVSDNLAVSQEGDDSAQLSPSREEQRAYVESHSVTSSDLISLLISCLDVIFWVVLAVAIIVFELCRR